MVKLYSEKRADLEEQQLHLNVGLGKIAETVEQVEEMQKSLAVKSQVHKAVTSFNQLSILTRYSLDLLILKFGKETGPPKNVACPFYKHLLLYF